jgi:hypothetical protein
MGRRGGRPDQPLVGVAADCCEVPLANGPHAIGRSWAHVAQVADEDNHLHRFAVNLGQDSFQS